MSKFTAEIDIGELIERLPIVKRIQLVRLLEKTTWAKQLDNVVDKIHRQIKRIPSEQEITKLCKRARKKVYERDKGNS